EARIPGTALCGFTGKLGAAWRLTLRYQNVMEIYQTMWQGIVTLRPRPHARQEARESISLEYVDTGRSW
ncbi:MAG TPA: hypothetical protein VLQ80_00835, partial [Candidatus Saccharimonadia bacterium]|nr:hypothetical protein [Candidatus Saccharimonadia bacterium]